MYRTVALTKAQVFLPGGQQRVEEVYVLYGGTYYPVVNGIVLFSNGDIFWVTNEVENTMMSVFGGYAIPLFCTSFGRIPNPKTELKLIPGEDVYYTEQVRDILVRWRISFATPMQHD